MSMRLALCLVLCVVSGIDGALAQVRPEAAAPERRRILVLYDEDRHDFPGIGQTDRSLRESFRAALGPSVEISSESMNLSQFERPGYLLTLAHFLRDKYAARSPDLIVAILDPPLDFLLRHRGILFQGIPIVFGGVDAAGMANRTLPADVTGVLVKRTFSPTVDIALRLQPTTRNIFVVGGTSSFDRYLQTLVRRDLQPYEGRVDVTYLFGLPMDGLLKRLASLPPESVILYLTVFADGAGRRFIPHEVLSTIAASANAPVYAFLDQFVGRGAVGGNVYSTDAHAAQVAALGLQVLRGASPARLPIREIGTQVDMFDARQLKRWNLNEARLPAGADVRFRDLSVWALYRWYILASLTVVVIEAALVGGLLFARARQRRAENEVRAAAEEMRQLHVRLANVENDERRALHVELHDKVCSNLAALRLELDLASSLVTRNEPTPAGQHLSNAREVATETMSMARDLMAELRPPALDDFGLLAAVRALAESQSARLGLPIQVAGVDPPARPSRLVEIALFRIAHEAVINAARHGAPTRIAIDLRERDGRVILVVADDGVGFDPEAPGGGPDHWGFKNMRERALGIGGQLELRTVPGAGTTITVNAPREPS
jgi:signal transduction histidine kinase